MGEGASSIAQPFTLGVITGVVLQGHFDERIDRTREKLNQISTTMADGKPRDTTNLSFRVCEIMKYRRL